MSKDNDAKIGDFGAAQRISDATPVAKLTSKNGVSGKEFNFYEATQLHSILEEEKDEGNTPNLLADETMLFSLSASNTLKRDYKNRKVGTPYYLAPELWLAETNNLCSK